MMETANSYRSPDGFKISAELGLTEFLNRKNEADFSGEYVHVIPDPEAGEIRVYRSVAENAGGPKIMTTIPGRASIRKTDEFDRPDGWYLTGGKGETLLTLLRCYRNETTADGLGIVWWPRNNSENMNRSDRDQETLIISYRTGSGREQSVQIDDTYDRPSHMMATGDAYKF